MCDWRGGGGCVKICMPVSKILLCALILLEKKYNDINISVK